jgi:ParB/RepB/Spo0J family partition protein
VTAKQTQDQNLPSATEKVVPLDSIRVIDNPRKKYDQAALKELADSIEKDGQLQSVVVRESSADPTALELIFGSRRYKAIQHLRAAHPTDPRWNSIRVSVQSHDDRAVRVIQISENVKREDLTVLELANAVADLRADGLTDQQIAEALGFTKRHVQRLLLVTDAPEWLRKFGDEVEVDEPKVDDAGNRVLDDGRPVFAKRKYPGFGFTDLHELVGFYSRLDAWDHKQQDSNTAHRPKAEAETRRVARKAAAGAVTGERFKELLSGRFAEVTGVRAPATVSRAERPRAAPFQLTEKKFTLDVGGLTEPLAHEELLKIKEDLVSILTKLGYTTVRLGVQAPG